MERRLLRKWHELSGEFMVITSLADPIQSRYYLWVSPSCERVTGFTPEKLKSKPWLNWVHPDDRHLAAGESDRLERCGGSGPSERMRYQHKTKSGGWIWLEWSTSPDEDSEGNLRLFGVARDVTEHVLHEEKTLAYIHDLERFASAAAHQLRSPPRTIIGMVDAIMEDDPNLSKDSIEFLQDIRTDAETMTEVVDGLTQFTKIRTMEEMDTEWLSVHDVVQDVRSRTLKLCPGPVVHIGLLPQATADAFLLAQVFENLISNSLKFNTSTLKVVKITGEIDCLDGMSVYHVSDNGIGIPTELVPKLFKMFERVHPGYPGSGVGLALVDAIIQRLGGRIWVDRSGNSGTVFSFTLPREAGRGEEDNKAKPHKAKPHKESG